VNQKDLQYIVNHTKESDASQILELIELTKQFPYFSWPFAALTKYYNLKKDYRSEATLHQAALRIHDRDWLYHYIHEQVDQSSITAEIENETHETEEIKDRKNEESKHSTDSASIEVIEFKQKVIKETPKIPIETQTTPIEPVPVYDLEKQFGLSAQTSIEEPQDTGASNDFYHWLNKGQSRTTEKKTETKPSRKVEQKDIIENFLISKPSITRPKKEFFKPEKAQKKGEKLSADFVTETLAKIYLKQDNPEKAIWAYQQLQLKFPEKSAYFAAQITAIEQNKNIS
jgi:hypothetical protein